MTPRTREVNPGTAAANRERTEPEGEAIRVRELSKRYRLPSLRFWRPGCTVTALSDVSFSCPRGRITCLLGPNGAGKTTILKILAGLVIADSGHAEAGGTVLTDNPSGIQRKVGIVTPNDRSFYWRLTGRQNLDFYASLHGLRGQEKKERIAHVLSALALEEDADKAFRLYSTGYRQKILLARALLPRPEILLLDEPTAHLDPFAKRNFHRIVREYLIGSMNATVLYCTHDLAEADELADHLVLLREGRVAAEGSIGALRKKVAPKRRLHLEFARLPLDGWTRAVPAEVRSQREKSVELELTDSAAVPEIVSAAVAHGGMMLSCTMKEETLADLLVRITYGDSP